MITFKLEEQEFIELNKLLKLLGLVGTGGEAFLRIDNEEILVNGQVETRRRRKLKNGDLVVFDSETIQIKS